MLLYLCICSKHESWRGGVLKMQIYSCHTFFCSELVSRLSLFWRWNWETLKRPTNPSRIQPLALLHSSVFQTVVHEPLVGQQTNLCFNISIFQTRELNISEEIRWNKFFLLISHIYTHTIYRLQICSLGFNIKHIFLNSGTQFKSLKYTTPGVHPQPLSFLSLIELQSHQPLCSLSTSQTPLDTLNLCLNITS